MLLDHFGKPRYSMLKYLVAIHYNLVMGGIKYLLGLAFLSRTAASGVAHIQFFGIAAIGMQMGGKNPGSVRCLHNCCTGTIAKNYSRVSSARCYIQGGGLNFSSHHENGFVHAGLDILIGYRQGINKARTCIADIQCTDTFKSQLALQQYPRTREK